MLTVAVARFSFDDNAALCTSDYVDDIMFSHNGAKGTESRTKLGLCFVQLASWRHRGAKLLSTINALLYQFSAMIVFMGLLFYFESHMDSFSCQQGSRRYQTSPALCNRTAYLAVDNRLVQRLQSSVCPCRVPLHGPVQFAILP